MRIWKIVITGGPCAGKTSALARLRGEFTARGFTVLTLPEAATELLEAGASPWGCRTPYDFQRAVLRLQLAREEIYEQAFSGMGERALLFCDRGAMDGKGYMPEGDFARLAAEEGTSEPRLLARYDAVFHLVSTAVDAPRFYTRENNALRFEPPERAAQVDRAILAAWSAHPRRSILDNSTDFEGKLRRLTAGVAAALAEENGEDP